MCAVVLTLNRPEKHGAYNKRAIKWLCALLGLGERSPVPARDLELKLGVLRCLSVCCWVRSAYAHGSASGGFTCAAAISGRLNKLPRRAEHRVASAGIIFPVGGQVGTGPPPV